MDGDFTLGPWLVQPSLDRLTSDTGRRVHLEPKVMAVLIELARRAGEVVSKDALMAAVWPGTFVSDHVLARCVSELRKALGDQPKNPRFVETIPKRGYRLIASVEWTGAAEPAAALPSEPRRRPPIHWAVPAVVVTAVVFVAALFLLSRVGPVKSPRSAPRTMLAVLPFENLTGDPDQEFLSDGFSEETTALLGRLNPQRLGVIARTSAMTYKGIEKPIDQIGRELGVDYVVEGSVRREADRVRVAVQLIRARDQTHVWAESYERDFPGVLALQRQVASEIASTLELELLPADVAAGDREPRPIDPAAQEAFLRGRYEFHRSSGAGGREESTLRAAESFRRAVELQPDHAPSHGGLAHAYIRLETSGTLAPSEAFPRARAAAERALELDATLPDAHAALGLVRLVYDWDWEGAEAALRRALELNPSDSQARVAYGFYLSVMGRYDEAIAEAREALVCDPLSIARRVFLARTFVWAARYDEAIEQARTILELQPESVGARSILYSVYYERGRFADAMRLLDEEEALSGRQMPWRRAQLLALMGRDNEAREILVRMAQGEIARTSPWRLAAVCAALHEPDQAFEWLEKSLDARETAMVQLRRLDPHMEYLRTDPRYQALLRRMGLQAG